MKQIISKKVLAWGGGLLNDEIFRKIKEDLDGRSYPGGPYSKKKDSGIETTKLTDIPVTWAGAGRDIGVESEWIGNPEQNIDPTSHNQEDIELGYDGRANDETGPGNTRIPPDTSHQTVELLSDNPLTISNLFRPDTMDRDKGAKVRSHLDAVYNKKPVRMDSRIHGVDQLVKRRMK